jgi:hypothetical protein
LAKVGFDANYALTSEGRMLEELIDRFYQAERPRDDSADST